jgi:transcriptional regulator with XRE-family HTH domain
MGIIVRGLKVPIWWSLSHVDEAALSILGKRIRQRRRSFGWTQEELAHRAGLDRSFVGGIERGRRNITVTTLCQVSRALECDVAALTKRIPAGTSK